MSFPAHVSRAVSSSVRGRGSLPAFPAGGGPSAPSSGGGEPDWRSLFERERRRAEELRRGEIGWRAKARSWRRQFEIGRDKLAAARAEAGEVRRAAREALSLRADVGRLKRLRAWTRASGARSSRRAWRSRPGEPASGSSRRSFARVGRCMPRRGSGARASAASGRGRTVRAANRPAPPAMAARPGRVSKNARKFTTPRRTSASAPIAGNRMWRTAPTRRN